jgi:hypothetical protein
VTVSEQIGKGFERRGDQRIQAFTSAQAFRDDSSSRIDSVPLVISLRPSMLTGRQSRTSYTSAPRNLNTRLMPVCEAIASSRVFMRSKTGPVDSVRKYCKSRRYSSPVPGAMTITCARVLLRVLPRLVEGFLREVGEPATARVLPPRPAGPPPDPARLAAIAKRHNIIVLGPAGPPPGR